MTKTPKTITTQQKRRLRAIEEGDPPVWIHGKVAAKRISVSLPVMYSIIKSGKVRTFLFKRHPEAQTGRRLIYWPDLERYMAQRCEEANQSGQRVWMPVRVKGKGSRRSIKQEMPAA
jgi:hypothetical protein